MSETTILFLGGIYVGAAITWCGMSLWLMRREDRWLTKNTELREKAAKYRTLLRLAGGTLPTDDV